MYSVRKIVRNEVAGSSDPNWPRHATVIVRSSLDEHVTTESLRAAIQQLDPAVPVVLETMDSHIQRFFTRPRFQTALLSMFAATGLLLAAIGLYGLISFLVAERTREIGVRMALGATPGDIAKLVVSDGVRWTAAGVMAGTAAASGLLRLLEGLLYQVKANDLRVFGGAIAVLAGVAMLAAWLPGRRASRIDPMAALRHD
jgi:putative ABC transport system permease protein